MGNNEHLFLLDQVKLLCKSTYLVVSDAQGKEFSSRALRSVAEKKGLRGETTTELAEALVAHLEYLPRRVGKLRHVLVRSAVSGKDLIGRFEKMRRAYVQQPLDYGKGSRYGDRWRISCYLVVLEKWKPKIEPHAPMVEALGDVMNSCIRLFEQWKGVEMRAMNCFVTRYRPVGEEDRLKKHIDGANVDGSVILSLPTDDPFEGGGLTVWEDRDRRVFEYPPLSPGDAIFLDGPVWHQAQPITSGTRYALVIFLKRRTSFPV